MQTVADEVKRWYHSKSFSDVKCLERKSAGGRIESDSDYRVVSCLTFSPTIDWTLSAEIWFCDGPEIGLGIGSYSDLKRWTGVAAWKSGFIAGFEPRLIDSLTLTSILNLCSQGCLRIGWLPIIRHRLGAHISFEPRPRCKLGEDDVSAGRLARIGRSQGLLLGRGFLPWI